MNYSEFIKQLDIKLAEYFKAHKDYICCKEGCSSCCEKGDYPLSQIELEYLMQGYISLENSIKQIVQGNIKNIRKGEKCPFLINSRCSVYAYRPIICRTHGLAYVTKNNIIKVPYCVSYGKNYASVYKDGKFQTDPILLNLDTKYLLGDIKYGEIRNLYDWIKHVDNNL